VPATAVWSARSGIWSLTVERCCFCGKRHHHGGNDGPEPDLGARQSHCITGEGGAYILIEAPESIEARAQRRGRRAA
jgi:hypothetical protein